MNDIKFEDIQKANEAIKTTDIKGKNYAEVNQRIKAFRMLFPLGTIQTDIVSLENGVVTMKSQILDDSGHILGTGYAQEKESSTFINKTSFIENCETSAVGRALGMCGFGIDTSVASYEEVANAIENQNNPTQQNQKQKSKKIDGDKEPLVKEIMDFYGSHKQFGQVIKSWTNAKNVQYVSDLSVDDLKELVNLARSSANSF
jgi:hypothetical protein